jgi:pimeloyl-ACP methyl ester carboxylesterase
VLDDAVHDLHQLLAAAKVSVLYILVGSSGGGFNVYHHVGRYPKEVAGLVMLDVPAGQAEMSAEDVKELAWDAPGNPEHMDYVAIERQMALHRLPIPAIPVTVITADAVQSATNPDEEGLVDRQLSPCSPRPFRRARNLRRQPPGSHRSNSGHAQARTGKPVDTTCNCRGRRTGPTDGPPNVLPSASTSSVDSVECGRVGLGARRALAGTREYPGTRSSHIHLR